MASTRRIITFNAKNSLEKSRRQRFRWIYSPSGRYGIDINYKEISQESTRPFTFFYRYRIFIIDLHTNTWSEYTSNIGALKNFYNLYWLDDNQFVLMTFSRNDSVIHQNVVVVDHNNQYVFCPLSRMTEWKMDQLADLQETVQKLTIDHQDYVYVIGFQDMCSDVYIKLLPFDPREGDQQASKEIQLSYLLNKHLLLGKTSPWVFGYGTEIFFAEPHSDGDFDPNVCDLSRFVAVDVDKALKSKNVVLTRQDDCINLRRLKYNKKKRFCPRTSIHRTFFACCGEMILVSVLPARRKKSYSLFSINLRTRQLKKVNKEEKFKNLVFTLHPSSSVLAFDYQKDLRQFQMIPFNVDRVVVPTLFDLAYSTMLTRCSSLEIPSVTNFQ